MGKWSSLFFFLKLLFQDFHIDMISLTMFKLTLLVEMKIFSVFSAAWSRVYNGTKILSLLK